MNGALHVGIRREPKKYKKNRCHGCDRMHNTAKMYLAVHVVVLEDKRWTRKSWNAKLRADKRRRTKNTYKIDSISLNLLSIYLRIQFRTEQCNLFEINTLFLIPELLCVVYSECVILLTHSIAEWIASDTLRLT